jgi:hypothetical protein
MVPQARGKRVRKTWAIGDRIEAHREQQPGKRRVKGKTGQLAGLLELPLDILLEVRIFFPYLLQCSSPIHRYLGTYCHWMFCIWHGPRSSSEVY